MTDILTKVKIHDLFRNLANLEKELSGDLPDEMIALKEMLTKTADYPHLIDRITSLEAENGQLSEQVELLEMANGHLASIISGLEAQNLELSDQICDARLENDRDQ